ncbi:MAG: hypothetical protein L0I76_09050 [Pseudonocardia sp.]|nr:hypothetical protein [Pseudonocardia sp.]
MTGNHPPLVSVLRNDARVGRARDLVAFTEADWLASIRGTAESGGVKIPASIPGATEADRESAYARRLMRDVERAWPTASVAASAEKVGSTRPCALLHLAHRLPLTTSPRPGTRVTLVA